MENNQDSLPHPFDIEGWRIRSKDKAESVGFPDDKKEGDAFRHIYTNAMIVWKYGFVSGAFYTEALGTGAEVLQVGWEFFKDSIQSAGEFLRIEIDKEKRPDFEKQIRESYMDWHNNQIGLVIGSTATSEADIISKTKQAIDSGQAIIDADKAPEKIGGDPSPALKDILPGDNVFSGGVQPGFDPSKLIDILGGTRHRDRAPSAGQVAMTSAAAIARELMKSKRRSLEIDMIDIFTGGKGGMFPTSTPPIVGNNSSQSGFADVMMNAVERVVGAAMNRTRTRTSTAESERSQEAGRSWSPSRSQQQAMLAQWAQAGTRNL